MAAQIHIVDVFAERPYTGNPLAVVLGADELSTDTMQKLAAETNYSETTFVTSSPEGDGGWRVRVFTPSREIEFTGHPILGTAWVVRQEMEGGAAGPVQLNLSVGPVTVTFEHEVDSREVAWFRAPAVTLGPTVSPQPIAAALGIATEEIDTVTPIQQCAAGTAAMIVPLRSLDALRRSRLNLDAYAPLAKAGFPPLIYLFCRETHHPDNDLCARFFFDAHGVREDPATGNGAAFLGAYLLAYRILPEEQLPLRIEQGYEVRRPSLVRLSARIHDGIPDVRVGGCVIPVIRGELC